MHALSDALSIDLAPLLRGTEHIWGYPKNNECAFNYLLISVYYVGANGFISTHRMVGLNTTLSFCYFFPWFFHGTYMHVYAMVKWYFPHVAIICQFIPVPSCDFCHWLCLDISNVCGGYLSQLWTPQCLGVGNLVKDHVFFMGPGRSGALQNTCCRMMSSHM